MNEIIDISRWRMFQDRDGTPLIISQSEKITQYEWLKEALADRDPNSDECMLWPFNRYNSGYGYVYRPSPVNKVHTVHRTAYELVNGAPEPGLFILHICKQSRSCFNAKHLYTGNRKQNAADCIRDGTDPVGENNPNAVLTIQMVETIRNRHAQGESIASITAHLGISSSMGWSAINNWQHLPCSLIFPGQRRGEDCPQAKATRQTVSDIREMYESGAYSQSELAALFGLSQSHVSRIILNKHWK